MNNHYLAADIILGVYRAEPWEIIDGIKTGFKVHVNDNFIEALDDIDSSVSLYGIVDDDTMELIEDMYGVNRAVSSSVKKSVKEQLVYSRLVFH